MGIYDKGFDFDAKGFLLRAQKPLIILAAILMVAFLAWILFGLFTGEAISFSFNKNPVFTSEQTILRVSIRNTTGITARDVIVQVFAEDKRSISVAPPIKQIGILDQFRELEFVINPVGEVLPGNYVINIKTEINGEKFSKQAVLTIERSV